MNKTFSKFSREEDLTLARNEVFDLIVIGGGITGAGIVLDATARGLKVLLIEKGDFASGTSSKSTKLIHGGLRYLKQLEFGLVKETGLERQVVHNLAPHLVHPEKMLLPIVQNGSFSKFSASIAISVYDYLARVKKEDRKKVLDKVACLNTEPLLKNDMVKSGIIYSEYRTDDARLTIEILKKAHSLGATIFNYLSCDGFNYQNGKIKGLKTSDQLSQSTYLFESKMVVSAAGPWVDEIRKLDGMDNPGNIRQTKGVHIVFPHEKLPVQQAVYFDDFNGRMLFAIPRGKTTYVGTTDTNFDMNKDKLICSQSDKLYLLSAINQMFKIKALTEKDIVSTWAGLRPLIQEEGKSPSELSRKDEIFESESGLISIAGGKLTGYRKMAERVVDMVLEKNKDLKWKACLTKEIKLTHSPFESYESVKNFYKAIIKAFSNLNFSKQIFWYLTTTYGSAATWILKTCEQNLNDHTNAEESLILAELSYGLNNEMVVNAEDFFFRRTAMAYFDVARMNRFATLINKKI